MRRSRAITIAAIGLLVVGGWSAWHFGYYPGAHKAGVTAQAAPQIPVTAETATARNVPVYVEGLGSVQAFNMVAIRPRVDGQITKVFFQEGHDVKAGDPLVQIDPRAFQAALEQAQATREKDDAQLQSAQLDLERASKLLNPGFQTRQGYDQQKATVAQLEATLKADQAQIDNAQLNLDYSLVRAPFDGRTGARQIDVGNLVQASQAANLVTIAQIKPIFVTFTVPAERLADIRKNQAQPALTVIAYAMDDTTVLAQGDLTLIDNQVDAATGTIRLKAQFDNVGEPLWPGEFVNARVVLSTRENAVTVTADAIMPGPTGSYVYVLSGDDSAPRRSADVAANQDGVAVISKGLQVGERVVTEGQYRLTEGAKVKVGAPQQADLGSPAAQ